MNASKRFVKIITGKTNCYLLLGDKGNALIDTGVSDKAGFMIEAIKKAGLRPGDLKYIIVTHTHFDHVGSLAELKQKTGAKVIVQEQEKDFLQQGFTPLPLGTNQFFRLLIAMAGWLKVSKGSFDGVTPDVIVHNRFDLGIIGLNGYLLHTPGHTAGSLSVVIEDKDCIVGDTLFNILPGRIFPPFADHPEKIPVSWQALLDTGCERFYPSHGGVISRERLTTTIRNLKKV